MLSGVVSKVGPLRAAADRDREVPRRRRTTGASSLLVLASISLVYGSLLAFRAPDFRGVVVYSSLAQSGLIVLGLFANNDLGFDGAVLQMVNHGLISIVAVPARRDGRAAHRRPASSRCSAGWRAAGPRSRPSLMTVGDHLARRAALDERSPASS